MIKLLTLGAVAFISIVATLSVWIVLADRMERKATSSAEIASGWGREQLIAGPVLSVPVERAGVGTNGQRILYRESLYLLPKKLTLENAADTEIRTLGIYETPVYTAHVKGSGTFDLNDIHVAENADTRILWNEASVSIHLSDARGVASAVELLWQGEKRSFEPSSRFTLLGESGIHTVVPIATAVREYPFNFEMDLRGSDGLSFLPVGEDTEVSLISDWVSPNFQGNFLPNTRELRADGFSAEYKIASYGRNAPQSWIAESPQAVAPEALSVNAFGVKLHQQVDLYTQIDRTMKYSILFIALTFLTFFMFETLAGLRLHPIQYLLVGLGIALFYLLLLSFSEIIGFAKAYILGAAAITILISGYCMSVLRATKRAGIIAALLAALYTYLYVLLQLEELALVFGSALLFAVLSIVMYLTRHFDWYTVTSSKK